VHRLRHVKLSSSRKPHSQQVDLDYQALLLPGVSRTFALTIPVLPDGLADVVANAYLLCRLADTIEDDVDLGNASKSAFHDQLVAVLRGEADAAAFSQELAPLLSDRTLAAERELVEQADRVIRITRSFPANERDAIIRCLSRMCGGMPEFQRRKSLAGLADLNELSAYCYVVAGVVGEMLTELFCEHCPELAAKQPQLLRLALSFGQGLQMTNILKDVWEDRRANTCWLPRSVFGDGSFDLARLDVLHGTPAYREGIEQLIGIAHNHLRNALDYTAQIPAREAGMRRFCLWAIGLAVLTLRKIRARDGWQPGERIKISRRSVKATVALVNLTYYSDRMLRWLFGIASAGLPLVRDDILPVPPARSARRQPDASRA
jgi:farnesyl-diphosphate farnesyltransferase